MIALVHASPSPERDALPLLTQARNVLSAAYQAVTSGRARMPEGSIYLDPVAVANAWRWTYEYTPTRLDQIKARRSYSEVIRLCEVMGEDDRWRACSHMRAMQLLGCEMEFVSGQGRKKRKALKAADPESDFWEMVPEAEWLQMVLWGLQANMGTGRLQWWEQDASGRYVPRKRSGRIVPRLEFWEPRNFRCELGAGRAWVASCETPESSTPVDRPMSWADREFVCFLPWGGEPGTVERGLWIAGCVLWLLKQHIIRSGGSLVNRMSTPIKVIEFMLGQQGVPVQDVGGADGKRKELVERLQVMERNGVVSLPPGFTMKLLGMPATSIDMLEKQLSMVNDAFAILWQGNNLTASIKGGSLAAANAGQDMMAKIKAFDARAETTFLHGDVMIPWATVNFGDPASAPLPCRDVNPPEDIKASAMVIDTMVRATVNGQKNGLNFDYAQINEDFNLRLVKGAEYTKLAPATTPVVDQVPNAS